MKKRRFAIIVFFAGLMSLGCEEESTFQQTDLLGEWEVVDASRNRKSTQTLNGAFFKFDEKNYQTNFMGQEQSYSYSFSKNEILQSGGENSTFKINYLLGDSLEISSTIRNIPFVFFLKKK